MPKPRRSSRRSHAQSNGDRYRAAARARRRKFRTWRFAVQILLGLGPALLVLHALGIEDAGPRLLVGLPMTLFAGSMLGKIFIPPPAEPIDPRLDPRTAPSP